MRCHEPADTSTSDGLVNQHTYSHTIRSADVNTGLTSYFALFNISIGSFKAYSASQCMDTAASQSDMGMGECPQTHTIFVQGCAPAPTWISNWEQWQCPCSCYKGYATKNWNSTLTPENQNNSQGTSILSRQAEMADFVFLFLLNSRNYMNCQLRQLPIRYEICVFTLYQDRPI